MKDDRARLKPQTEPILEAASKFLWSEQVRSSFGGFCKNRKPLSLHNTLSYSHTAHAPTVRCRAVVSSPMLRVADLSMFADASSVDGEQKLEYAEAYRNFQELFEVHLPLHLNFSNPGTSSLTACSCCVY